jgi:hypothetical protein
MNQVDADAIDKHSNKKAMIGVVREAVQTAEDARAITVNKIDQERLVQQSAWQQPRSQNWQSAHRTWQQRGGYHGYRIPEIAIVGTSAIMPIVLI